MNIEQVFNLKPVTETDILWEISYGRSYDVGYAEGCEDAKRGLSTDSAGPAFYLKRIPGYFDGFLDGFMQQMNAATRAARRDNEPA